MSSLTRHLEEALAYFEAFRRLGFPSDEIFLTATGPLAEPEHMKGKTQIGMVLQTQGKQFVCVVGYVEAAPTVIFNAWKDAGRGWNGEWPDSRRDEIWRRSHVYNNAATFMLALMDKGIKTPIAGEHDFKLPPPGGIRG